MINSFEKGFAKNLEKKQYGEILKDKSTIFHGIGFDLIRLQKILDNGILSEQAASDKRVEIIKNYGGYNLSDSISVGESPAINNTYTFGVFKNFIANGISFVIEGVSTFKAMKGEERDSGFIDEAFVYHSIPKKNIKGIMIPEKMLDIPLSKIPIGLSKMGHGYIDNRCRKIIKNLEEEYNFKADTSILEKLMAKKAELEESNLDYLELDAKTEKIFEQMDKFMQVYLSKAYSKKFNISNPTLKDILLQIIPKGMNVYNSDGFPIQIDK